ncbi:hypothetical protein GCM10011588_10810 [Nocardia jinanensis]|uniref:Tn3 transposase DDE domain-containing protein n=1 Tax=Nocardia jinanensis TaxID=382504 RepID=A0A917RAA3_9NOCA|nr:hypothetical protein GCM10011588_10810 [Nocardia jinanensis]
MKRNLIAVLLAHSTNLGLTRMAEACGISYDILSWTDEWYVREETLRAANLAIIDYHQRLPLTPVFGAGTLSSSDGQRFPTRGKSTTSRPMSRYFAHEGMIRARQLADQTEQAWCLTLATNAVIAWTTEYYGLAAEQMRRSGQRIDDEILAHISPAHSANINFFGAIEVDIDAELAQLGPTGYRPLRVRDTLF